MAPSRSANYGRALPRRQFIGVFSIILLLFLGVVFFTPHAAPGKTGFQFDDTNAKIKHRASAEGDLFLIGVGKADITGPVVSTKVSPFRVTIAKLNLGRDRLRWVCRP